MTNTDTYEQNNRRAVDWNRGMTLEELRRDRPPTRVKQSLWIRRVHELVERVAREEAEVGVYYLLGEFQSDSGARQTILNLAKRAERLPAVSVDLQAMKARNGNKGSELWGAVVVDT